MRLQLECLSPTMSHQRSAASPTAVESWTPGYAPWASSGSSKRLLASRSQYRRPPRFRVPAAPLGHQWLLCRKALSMASAIRTTTRSILAFPLPRRLGARTGKFRESRPGIRNKYTRLTRALRWKKPQDLPIPANGTAVVVNATAYGPTCPQAIRGDSYSRQDEDCLNLNVWAPAEGAKLPVRADHTALHVWNRLRN